MRWAFHGYYGVGNLGDDLMLHALVRYVERMDPGAEIVIFLARAGTPERLHVPTARPVRVCTSRALRTTWAELRVCDVLVFGGGTCLHDHGFCGLRLNVLAALAGTPAYWIGIGAEGVHGLKPCLYATVSLALAHGVTVRDARSARHVRALAPWHDAPVTEDLAYLAHDAPAGDAAPTPPPRPHRLAVGWRDFGSYLTPDEETRACRHAATALARLVAKFDLDGIDVVNLADLVDREANARLAEALRETLGPETDLAVHADVPLARKVALVQGATCAVSARLHGLFVGKAVGTPTVGVAYAAKVERFAERFNAPLTVPLSDLVHTPEALVRVAEAEFDTPAAPRALMAVYRRRALQNVTYLAEALGLEMLPAAAV